MSFIAADDESAGQFCQKPASRSNLRDASKAIVSLSSEHGGEGGIINRMPWASRTCCFASRGAKMRFGSGVPNLRRSTSNDPQSGAPS